MTPRLSVVTGTLNRLASLQRLVNSLCNNTSVTWELIIADASNNPSYALHFIPSKPEQLLRIHSIWEVPRLGHVKGYNQAFKQSQGEYVVWLNDDAEVLPGYDTRGIAFLESHPELGLGAYYYREVGATHSYFHVNACFNMIFANFGILRRDFGDSINWFDESFYMYGGDNSITFRTLLAGRGVAQVPGASIIHHSEKDDVRISNEEHRRSDGGILSAKYSSLRREMQLEYNRHKRLVGPRILVSR